MITSRLRFCMYSHRLDLNVLYRMERALMKASLPFPIGCGLFKAADQGAIACGRQCQIAYRMTYCSNYARDLVLLWMMLGIMPCTHLGVVIQSFGPKQNCYFLEIHLVCWTDPCIRLPMLPLKFDCARRFFVCVRAEESKSIKSARVLHICLFL